MTRILVADDDRLILFSLAEGLRTAGFEVSEAQDGLEALRICLSNPPDLALLDIHMPGMDGLELAQRLRNETTVPFVFLSAYDDEAFVQRAVGMGALGYLIKPISVAALMPMLRTALARSRDLTGLRDALSSNRTVATAVGMTMQADGVDQPVALEQLRQEARRQRSKLEDVAKRVIESGRK